MSMSGALAYRPDRSEAVFVFHIKEGSYNTESLIAILTELHDHLDEGPVTVIWDGLPYAYDLNPTEQIWGNVKARELPTSAPTPSTSPGAAQAGREHVGTGCASTSLAIPAFSR